MPWLVFLLIRGGFASGFKMFEAASFPHLGRVLEPTREDYLKEAELSERVGHWYTGFKFRCVARRLQWTPAALQQMKDAA